MSKIKLITSGKNWIEHTAVTQLEELGQLNGVIKAVAWAFLEQA